MENAVKEMQEIIKKHLPEQVGKELQKVLKRAEEDRRDLDLIREELKESREANRKIVKDCSDLDEEIKALKAKVGDLDKRELAITKRELSYDRDMAVSALNSANDRNEALERLCGTLFAGGRRYLTRESSKSIQDQWGNLTEKKVVDTDEIKETED